MIENNTLIRTDDTILRTLAVTEDKVFAIDCIKRTMPKWYSREEIGVETCMEEELIAAIGAAPAEEELTPQEKAVARSRYSLVAGVLPFLDDDSMRNAVIKKITEENGITRKTLTTYLCNYLAYNNVNALARKRKIVPSKELTKDEKNMRWALNRYYYTRHGNSIADAYTFMIKEKYTDSYGNIMAEHPSIYQFRYFFRKTRKKQTEIISRQGIKEYQLNHRPLLGDGVQEMASAVGWGMLDGTVCDIYLVDDAGKLVGRPVLLACVDAFSGLCCGYSLLWEGGVYSVRELLLNVITDKAEWCRQFGISVSDEQWPCNQLPGIIITDRGSEYISFNFEQITELGCRVISLPSFSANLKGPVEKLFDLIQNSYKPYLKGKGVIEPDFQKRGAKDYRKQACLTIEDFEKIIIRCILYHNSQRILETFPYSDEMLEAGIKPYPAEIWAYGQTQPGCNLISVSKEQLILTLLPRTEGRFSREGLKVNKMRYHCEGYTEKYLNGGTATVAYNPDDVNAVYLVEDNYKKFELIERRYEDKSLLQVEQMKESQRALVKARTEEQLQAKVDLASQIELIASRSDHLTDTDIKGIRKTRKKERANRHRDLISEVEKNDLLF